MSKPRVSKAEQDAVVAELTGGFDTFDPQEFKDCTTNLIVTTEWK